LRARIVTAKNLFVSLGLIALIYLVAAMAACSHPSGIEAGAGFYDRLIGFYSGPLDHLSAVRAGACPMHPSCSEYSRQAISQYGFAAGWVMTMDRLMRCGRDETRRAPKVLVDGQWKFYDPVEVNKF